MGASPWSPKPRVTGVPKGRHDRLADPCLYHRIAMQIHIVPTLGLKLDAFMSSRWDLGGARRPVVPWARAQWLHHSVPPGLVANRVSPRCGRPLALKTLSLAICFNRTWELPSAHPRISPTSTYFNKFSKIRKFRVRILVRFTLSLIGALFR